MTMITGSGGGGKLGGGSSRTPTTAKDSLDSRQYANVIDLISEGEIEGLVDGHKSIFLNNTALLSADGVTYNFTDVTIYTRNGTQSQSYIPLTVGPENENGVGITVRKDVPKVVTITDVDVDAVRVTISIPALQKINNTTGDTLGTSVQLTIAVQYAGGGFATSGAGFITDTITGRTGDEYRKDYIIELTRPSPSAVVDIKVTRITADSTDTLLSNDIIFSSYTEIVYAKLTYPNSALIGLRVDAEQFSSIPQRSYLIKGIKVRIPNGVTVDQDTGRIIYPDNFIWDGTFAPATWCACPAWVLYDLLTATRYGFGDHILTDAEKTTFASTGNASRLDKWAFFAASKYSNQLVDTGLGNNTQEARFSCNVNIQTAEDSYKLVNDLLSVMRCQGFWSSGSLTIAQDAPTNIVTNESDPVYLFSLANVGEGGFSYSGSSLKTRPNVAVVGYFDNDLRNTAYEVVEDTAAIDKYGAVRTEITAFACTSRGQANRVGKWLLYSEQNENEICTFTVSVDAGIQVRPGQIVKISDPLRDTGRRAGRVAAATTTTITVDDTANTDLTYEGGSKLYVILPDGTVESPFVSSIVGAVITLQSPLSAVPNVNTIWVLEAPVPHAELWRILGVEEQDGAVYAITALSHNPSKYAAIEDGAQLTPRITNNLNQIPASPTDLALDTSNGAEQQYELNGRIAVKITFSWKAPQGIKFFRVKYRFEDDNFTTVKVQGPSFDILDVKTGNYQIEVSSISASGILYSTPAFANYTTNALNAPPGDVTGLTLMPINESNAVLSWTQAADLDVRVGGKVVIRHDPRSAALAEWGSSNSIVDAVAGSSTQKQVPLIPGTYLIKFEDYLGNRSSNAASIYASLPQYDTRLQLNLYVASSYVDDYYYTGVQWRDEQLSSPFSGTKVNCSYDGTETALVLVPNLYVEDGYYEPMYANGDSTAEYYFAETLDMGATYDVNFRRYILSRIYANSSILFDSVGGLFDSQPGFFDGATNDAANVKIYIRATTDNPASSPTWGDWNELINNVVRGRAFQIKAVLSVFTQQSNLAIEELGAIPELVRRIEASTNPTASTTVTYGAAFYDVNSLNITPVNLPSNGTYQLTASSRTGFSLGFTVSGATIEAQYHYSATGYGRAV